MINTIIHADCLKIMKEISDRSIDMILCDLPYGSTKNKWDIIIPFNKLWEHYTRIIKDHGAIVLSATQPFTSILITSAMHLYRHCWVWHKNNSAAFFLAKIRPFQVCEDIIVFGLNKVNYYPQMEIRGKERYKGGYSASTNYDVVPTKHTEKSNTYYPKNLISISGSSQVNKIHPTQKPVPLFEYLIQTYTQEGDIVLDNCAGSFTTAVACDNLNRQWICIEKELKYCEIGLERVNSNRVQLNKKILE